MAGEDSCDRLITADVIVLIGLDLISDCKFSTNESSRCRQNDGYLPLIAQVRPHSAPPELTK